VCAVALTGCRQDMQDQPKYKPLAESEFFSDHRSARPQIPGTVARGHLRIDQALYTGKVGSNDIEEFPFPITKEDMLRGQGRFNIYCSPCHSRLGDGNGMIPSRGFKHPPSYHEEKLKKAPVGHFFDVMSNGFGAMSSYASRVAVDDRWRIAAYIRALQLSQSATLADVPPGQTLEPPPPSKEAAPAPRREEVPNR
jgi:mono/diheme cytochrome c family protein